MNKYVYYVEGCNIEVSAVATDQKTARKLAWESLTDEQKNAAACLDWIDTEAA
jgi:hypothetical protein